MQESQGAIEFERIKENPWYYATNYLKVNGEPFTTSLTENEFNQLFNDLQSGNYLVGVSGRKRQRP